jgi:hypothetical protein
VASPMHSILSLPGVPLMTLTPSITVPAVDTPLTSQGACAAWAGAAVIPSPSPEVTARVMTASTRPPIVVTADPSWEPIAHIPPIVPHRGKCAEDSYSSVDIPLSPSDVAPGARHHRGPGHIHSEAGATVGGDPPSWPRVPDQLTNASRGHALSGYGEVEY